MRQVDASDIDSSLWLQRKKKIVDIASDFFVDRVGFAYLQDIDHPLTVRFSSGNGEATWMRPRTRSRICCKIWRLIIIVYALVKMNKA